MGKKYIESSKLIDKNALYTPAEALELAVKNIKFSKVSNAETNETCLLLSKLHIAAKKIHSRRRSG